MHSKFPFPFAPSLLVVFLTAWVPSSAGATVAYDVSVSTLCEPAGFMESDTSNTSGDWAVVDASVTAPGCAAGMQGIAGDGFLGVMSIAGSFADSEPRTYTSTATVNTSARFSGIFLELPETYVDGDIQVALAFDLSAVLSASVVDGGNLSSGRSLLTAGVSVSAGGASGGPPVLAFREEIFVNDTIGDEIPPGDGISVQVTLVTDLFEMDPTQPMVVELSLNSLAVTGAALDTVATAEVLAMNSLSFRENNPFILPEGFSVDYADANIFDNQFVDPRSVPEPSAAFLLIVGAVLLRARGVSRR